MAEPQPDMSWRTPEFRQKILSQIDEVWRTNNMAMTQNRTAADLEEQMYQKVKSKEEYLLCTARLVCRFRGINLPQNMNLATVSMILNQAGTQDPIVALKTIVNFIVLPGSHGNTPTPTAGATTAGGASSGAQMVPGQVGARPGFNAAGGYAGAINVPRRTGVMPGAAGMRGGDMFMAQQQIRGAGGMVSSSNINIINGNQMMQGSMTPQQQQYQYQMNRQQPGHFNMMHQMTPQQQLQTGITPGSVPAGTAGGMLMHGGASAGTALMMGNGAGTGMMAGSPAGTGAGMMMPGGAGMGNLMGGGAGTSIMMPGGSSTGMSTGMMMGGGAPTGAGMLMPGTSGVATAMVPSPASLIPSHSPGPSSQQHIAQSPVSNRGMGGAMSPGSSTGGIGSVGSAGMATTPGNPSSIGVVGTNVRSGTNEEQEYLEKWKQLQKYIDPLKRMISKIDKDEERKSELVKMKNLLDILSDSNKRLAIDTLNKCEHVLEKQLGFKPSGQGGSGGSTGPPSAGGSVRGEGGSGGGSGPALGVCQAIYDAVAAHIKSPTFNHTMQRTFTPVIRAIHGPPLRVDSPPAKRRGFGDERDWEWEGGETDGGYDIFDFVQGEIGRLPIQFVVNLDPVHHPGSKFVLLTCKLNGKYLPSLPELIVALPDGYPSVSPVLKCIPVQYESCEYLRRLKEILLKELNRITGLFSLTALLNLWETCARKAYLELEEALQ